jgi:DNA polymerase III alpha subunit
MFIPLHVKSHYSAGYGTATVEALVEAARAAGISALALTDIENLYGLPKFHELARASGLRPITGLELRRGHSATTVGNKSGRLVLWARDAAGYESLCRIVTARRGTAASTPDPLDCLQQSPRGVFFASDDRHVLESLLAAGIPPQDIRFLLIRPSSTIVHPPAGIRAVADPDVVMLDPADHDLQRLQMAIHSHRLALHAAAERPERSLIPIDRLAVLYQDVPEALLETQRIAATCTFEIDPQVSRLPQLPAAEGLPAAAQLARRCESRLAAARQAGRLQADAYERRLRHELEVLCRLGFAAYLLLVERVVAVATEMGVAIHGRGSAGGSLVAYLLGFTTTDPIEHGLYFERFVHERRRSLPDVDLDVASNRRDAVLERIVRDLGAAHATMISTHATFGPRGALRAGLRALGMPPEQRTRFFERLPGEDPGLESWSTLPLEMLPPAFRGHMPLVEKLVGKFQHLSVHPGGIVFGTSGLEREMPLERAPKGTLVTQYDMHALAWMGYPKLDLLGNRALAAIQDTRVHIGDVPEMPDGDAATLEAVSQGRTIGCFQIETPAMRSTLRKLPASPPRRSDECDGDRAPRTRVGSGEGQLRAPSERRRTVAATASTAGVPPRTNARHAALRGAIDGVDRGHDRLVARTRRRHAARDRQRHEHSGSLAGK